MARGSAQQDADGLSHGTSSARADDHDMPMYEIHAPVAVYWTRAAPSPNEIFLRAAHDAGNMRRVSD